jgi:hypothetical protein
MKFVCKGLVRTDYVEVDTRLESGSISNKAGTLGRDVAGQRVLTPLHTPQSRAEEGEGERVGKGRELLVCRGPWVVPRDRGRAFFACFVLIGGAPRTVTFPSDFGYGFFFLWPDRRR